MFFRGQKASLCLVIVGLLPSTPLVLTIRTIGAYYLHNVCGGVCISKEWSGKFIMTHS